MEYVRVNDQSVGLSSITLATKTGVPVTSFISGTSLNVTNEQEEILNQGGTLASPIGVYHKPGAMKLSFTVSDLNRLAYPFVKGETIEDIKTPGNVNFAMGPLKPNVTIAIASEKKNIRPGYYFFAITDLANKKFKLFYINSEQHVGADYYNPTRELLSLKGFSLVKEGTYALGMKNDFPSVSLEVTIKTSPSPALSQNDYCSFFVNSMAGFRATMPSSVRKPECSLIATSAIFSRSFDTIHFPLVSLKMETLVNYETDNFSNAEVTGDVLQHQNYSYVYSLVHADKSVD